MQETLKLCGKHNIHKDERKHEGKEHVLCAFAHLFSPSGKRTAVAERKLHLFYNGCNVFRCLAKVQIIQVCIDGRQPLPVESLNLRRASAF